MTTNQSPIAVWMESLGFINRNVSYGYTGWFQAKDGSISMVRPSTAAFFYKQMIMARKNELQSLLNKHLEDPTHELDIPDYVECKQAELDRLLEEGK